MKYNNDYINFIKLSNVRKIYLSSIIYSCFCDSLNINDNYKK